MQLRHFSGVEVFDVTVEDEQANRQERGSVRKYSRASVEDDADRSAGRQCGQDDLAPLNEVQASRRSLRHLFMRLVRVGAPSIQLADLAFENEALVFNRGRGYQRLLSISSDATIPANRTQSLRTPLDKRFSPCVRILPCGSHA